MATLKEIMHEAQDKMHRTVEAVNREFGTIRTGRASSSLVEGLQVECYGSHMPLKQLATISTPDPKMIVI